MQALTQKSNRVLPITLYKSKLGTSTLQFYDKHVQATKHYSGVGGIKSKALQHFKVDAVLNLINILQQ